MYLWHESFSTWAKATQLHIDALGLVTILGADEIDTSVGRLVQSLYFDLLPQLGAYVIAGNKFAEKQAGFAMYDMSTGVMTTELAAWFSRWLKSQDLYQVRSIVKWAQIKPQTRWAPFWAGLLLVGVPINGMLVALTVLSEDWWGFANAMAMIVSVLVRWILITQNRTGIDRNVTAAEDRANTYMEQEYDKELAKHKEEFENYQINSKRLKELEARGFPVELLPTLKKPRPPGKKLETSKVIVVMDNSKVIQIEAPEYLIRVFAINPTIPNPFFYNVVLWVGFFAFGIHIVSIGMASLPTQIYTVVLLAVATILNIFKVGCDDSVVWRTLRTWGRTDGPSQKRCLVSSMLQASCSSVDPKYTVWKLGKPPNQPGKIAESRQDLFVWLDLTEEEEENMRAWNLIPRNDQWSVIFRLKQDEYRTEKRTRGQVVESGAIEKESAETNLTRLNTLKEQ
ncbi:hypothetical protein F5882DRAFT_311266 [Hyaloscypha sp. PMI_1271]|nr:hypothetical protein F5882DRAFT_311266 [Hyaloscypha sp. PMI_1271]